MKLRTVSRAVIVAGVALFALSSTAMAANMPVDGVSDAAPADATPQDDPVPAPTWTLNIPADMEVPYGSVDTYIGPVTVSNVQNLPSGADVSVTANFTDFTSGSHVIPTALVVDYWIGDETVQYHAAVFPELGLTMYLANQPDTSYWIDMYLLIDSEDWASAAPGTYTATVTYSSSWGLC